MNQLSHYMPATVPPDTIRNCYVANDIELVIDVLRSDANTQLVSSIDAPLHALHSAIALGEQDTLLQAVASWLEQDFAWQPQEAQSTSASFDVTLVSATNSALKVGLVFKHNRDSLPPFPSELNDAVVMHTHTKSVCVCLAELYLNDKDQQKLGPGSCILLPDTFTPDSNVRLVDAQTGEHLADALLDNCQGSLRFPATPPNDTYKFGDEESVNRQVTRVVLRDSIDMHFPSWGPHAQSALKPIAGQAVIVEVVDAKRYNAKLFRVGAGLAALLDEPQHA